MRPGRESLLVALLLAAIVLAVEASGVLVRLDHLILDAGQRFSPRVVPDDVVVVAIDEVSLDRLGRWPWPRRTHAALISRLCAAGPAVIGVDVAFAEPSPSVPDDALLAQAIADCGRVVLPLVIETAGLGRQVLESPPIAALLNGVAGLGRVSVRLDEDGIARSVDLREGVGSPAWPLLSEELLRVAGQPVPRIALPQAAVYAGTAHELMRQGTRLIDFAGPPGHFPRVSAVSVLEGRVPPGFFVGKTVFVGATAVGLGDFLPTPVSAHAQPMPGVEVQANLWLAMRDDRLIEVLPNWVVGLVSVLLALLPLGWLRRSMPLPGLLASVCWVALVIVASAFLPVIFQRWFPPAAAVLGGLSAFPLWSWRRLEAARRHLDHELVQLAEVLPPAMRASESVMPPKGQSFEQRIAWVQSAQTRLRDLELQRNDALAFISHDLRSPLANAVLQLEAAPDATAARLLPSLRRAHTMAQDFLHLARAEALDPRQMRELEVGSLLHQAADEMFVPMRQRGQTIERRLSDVACWVQGDFAALERCVINFLQNAMAYGPAGSTIRIGLTPGGEAVRLWVENEGAALDEAQIERLFRRYSRGVPSVSAARRDAEVTTGSEVAGGSGSWSGRLDAEGAGGAGLGLFYVRTVAEKHGGTAGLVCEQGRVRFWIELPTAPGLVATVGSPQ